MMKKIWAVTVLSLLLTTMPYQTARADDATVCENRIDVKVNGLVCDFCARALEKVFGKRAEVESIKVDLDNGNITVVTKSGQALADDTVKQLITESGYDVTAIKHGC